MNTSPHCGHYQSPNTVCSIVWIVPNTEDKHFYTACFSPDQYWLPDSERSQYSCTHAKRQNQAENSPQQGVPPTHSAPAAPAACSAASTIHSPAADCVSHITHKLLPCTQCLSLSPHPLLSDYTPCSCSWGLQCKPPRLSQGPTLQTPSARRWGWTGARPPGKGRRAGADGTGRTGMRLSESSCPAPFHQPGSRCCSWEREQTKMLSECKFLLLLIYCEQQSTTGTERGRAKTLFEHFQVDPTDSQAEHGTIICKN